MRADTTKISVEELLAEATWLRRLARHLVDEPTAEDVVQETYSAALTSPPRAGGPLRPWLGTVLRNLVRMNRRERGRRTERERHAVASSTEALPTPEELLAHHQALRMVAEAVESLDEPYRSTVLLCYTKGLTSSELARRQGIRAGTVRWRLKRGLQLAREKLDRRHRGDRRTWAVLIMPVVATGSRELPPLMLAAKGAFVMKVKSQVAAVAMLLLLLGGAAVWWRMNAHAPIALQAQPAGTVRSPSPMAGRSSAKPAQSASLPRLTAVPADAQDPAVTPATGTIEGTVRDSTARPLAGARVSATRGSGSATGSKALIQDLQAGRFVDPAATAIADERGRYRLSGLRLGDYLVTAAFPALVPGHRPGIQLAAGSRAVTGIDLTLDAGGATLRGRVLDAGGGTIAGAHVAALAEGDAVGAVLIAVSDADGRYELALRRGKRYALGVRADGYSQPRLPSETMDTDRTKDIVLEPAAEVSGRVVERRTSDGVAEATVRLARADSNTLLAAKSDGSGGFVFRGVVPGTYRLWARQGKLAGRCERVLTVGQTEAATGLVLALDVGRAVAGHVRTTGGAPVAAAALWFDAEEGTETRERQTITATDGSHRIEGALPGVYWVRAAAPGFAAATRKVSVVESDADDIDFALAPDAAVAGRVLTAAGAPAPHVRVTAATRDATGELVTYVFPSDGEGRFRVSGLGRGEVTMGAEDPALGVARPVRVELGHGEHKEVTLRFEPGARLSGRVRWDDGRPAAGAVVTAFQGPSGGRLRRTAVAAGDGRFTLFSLRDGETRVFVGTVEVAAEPKEPPAGPRALVTVAARADNPVVDLTLPRSAR